MNIILNGWAAYQTISSRLLARFLYPMAAGVVFQTKDAQAWFPKHIQRKSRVIMNQVNPTFFTTQRVSEDYFVATGRLNNQKNYPLMIKAFAKFSKEFPHEKLYIFGTGQLREELSALINELDVSIEKAPQKQRRQEAVPGNASFRLRMA